jgi:hypothetical protein
VTSAGSPVSKVPLSFSPGSSVVSGQAGFAKQFHDFQELAQSAATGTPTSTTSVTLGGARFSLPSLAGKGPAASTTPVTSAGGPVFKAPLVSSPDSSVVNGQTGLAQQFHGSRELAQSAGTAPAASTTPVTSATVPVYKAALVSSPDSPVVNAQAGLASQFHGSRELAQSAGTAPVASTTPVTSAVGPVSKAPLVSSPDSPVVNGQTGLAQQFHDSRELAQSAGKGPAASTTPVTSATVPVSKAPLVSSPDSSVVNGQAGLAKQFHGSRELAQSAGTASAASTTPVTSATVPVSKVPLVFSPDSPVVNGQAGSAKQFHGSRELAQSGGSGPVRSPRARMMAGASRPSARPATSTTKAVAKPEQVMAAAPAPATARALPSSGKIGPSVSPSRTRAAGVTQVDGPAGSDASGVGQSASPATDPNAPISNVPLVAWLEQAALPNQVRNLHESAAPAASGGKPSAGGAPASDGLQVPAGKKEAGNSDRGAWAPISLQPRSSQPPPVSGESSVVNKDGVESPASGESNSAAAAAPVTVSQAGAQAAAAMARPPFLQAAPPDAGITPPGVESSTPEKPGQPLSGLDSRTVNAEAGTPSKAESTPADLAVAVRVKAQTTPAASVPGAPAKESRRVDLADATPAAGLRTETSRAGAWVTGENPARGGSQPTAGTASRLPERLEAPPIRAEEAAPRTAAPLKDLSIQIGQSSEESVELRVIEREGELHVAVRTGDADLAHGLRQGLPELVDHLDQSGFRAEAWRPSGVVSAPGPSSQAPPRSPEPRNADSQSQPGWSQQDRGQRDHNQSNRPKWVEELEGNLAGDGERSTGEFHGFSR